MGILNLIVGNDCLDLQQYGEGSVKHLLLVFYCINVPYTPVWDD